jgi:hypothetical protein
MLDWRASLNAVNGAMRKLVFVLAVLLISAPAFAQLPRPIGAPPVGAAPLTNGQILEIAFTEIERKMIGDFYARQRAEAERQAIRQPATQGRGKGGQAMPPGLAKRDELPPGMQKRVEKRGTLPPGIAKKALPSDLNRLLPRPAYGTERIIIDTDVLLVQIGTGLVIDILVDALIN